MKLQIIVRDENGQEVTKEQVTAKLNELTAEVEEIKTEYHQLTERTDANRKEWGRVWTELNSLISVAAQMGVKYEAPKKRERKSSDND